MMYGLLPFLLLIFIMGFTAFEGDWARSTAGGTRQEISVTAQSQMFMAYRDAVLSYLETKPNLTGSGTIPTSALTLPPGVVAADLPASISNYVVVSGGTYTAYVYEAAVPGIIAAFNQEFPGDESIGIVTGSTWTSAPGGVSSTLPIPLTNGDTISVFQIGD
jgi:hypothetical protein